MYDVYLQSFMYQLCTGLAHCHSHGVMHRWVLSAPTFNFSYPHNHSIVTNMFLCNWGVQTLLVNICARYIKSLWFAKSIDVLSPPYFEQRVTLHLCVFVAEIWNPKTCWWTKNHDVWKLPTLGSVVLSLFHWRATLMRSLTLPLRGTILVLFWVRAMTLPLVLTYL